MKTMLYFFLPFIGISVQAQVGINTENPHATLDVMPNVIDSTKADGIIAPRLKGSELKNKDSAYKDNQTGTIDGKMEWLAP